MLPMLPQELHFLLFCLFVFVFFTHPISFFLCWEVHIFASLSLFLVGVLWLFDFAILAEHPALLFVVV